MINEDILNDLDDLDSGDSGEKRIDELSEEEDDDVPQGKLSHLLSNTAFIEHMTVISNIVDGKIGKGDPNRVEN